MYANLSEGENRFLKHWQRWGRHGYPIRKLTRGWAWDDMYGVKGAPVVYKTKSACAEAIERYIESLCDRAAGRA